MAPWLSSKGYTVLLYDRAHTMPHTVPQTQGTETVGTVGTAGTAGTAGASTVVPSIGFGLRECTDVLSAANFLRHSRGCDVVVAMGAEGGAVAAIIAAASRGGEGIDGVVAENPFTTGEAMLQVSKRERK